MYIDFDRLLHWIKNYQVEFEKIITNTEGFDFVLIGRTERAHNTHHIALLKTETILNTFYSKILDEEKRLDFLCPNWIMTKTLAERVLSLELYTSTGFYVYWSYVLWMETTKKIYLEVEGQEYETPDRYREEIKKIGYENWLKTLDTGKEWTRRVNLVEDTFTEFMRHGQFKYELK